MKKEVRLVLLETAGLLNLIVKDLVPWNVKDQAGDLLNKIGELLKGEK